MLTAKAFCFCLVLGVFKETVSWTIDLPQVRKYFFEKSLDEKSNVPDRVIYDNVQTKSRHFDYEKYRKHYADEYQYEGYMEQKVHNAVRNGSAYLEGLRMAIEDYTRRLEDCRRLNFTTNIIQLRPNITIANFTDSFPLLNQTNLLPTNFTFNMPPDVTSISALSMNFTEFMRLSTNYTMFNISDGLSECMRADLASEHVRRLAQLAIWAANELQDKLFRDQYEQHGGHSSHHDDTLVLRLAWFLDRLAHLTGYDPKPEDFLQPQRTITPSPTPPMLSLIPVMISNEEMQFLLGCLNSSSTEPATERCRFRPRADAMMNPNSYQSRSPSFPSVTPDLQPAMSENHEYVYSEQDYAEENMPLSLPPRPVTAVKRKVKRSVQVDPLQNVLNYYTKYKAWTGSNQEIKQNSGEIINNKLQPTRVKRFVVKKKGIHFKIENPMPFLSGIVKHKIGVHFTKDKVEAKKIKKFLEKLNVLSVKSDKKKKTKRSVVSGHYRHKYLPRVPMNPQGDISYYIKNKKGTNYDYNAAQAALVRAGLEQAYQTGNILVVQRYGSNYNPANTMQIFNGYVFSSLSDV